MCLPLHGSAKQHERERKNGYPLITKSKPQASRILVSYGEEEEKRKRALVKCKSDL